MKMKKFDNASVIETLKNAGCSVGIRHLRRWVPIVRNVSGLDCIYYEVEQNGGETEVVIFADDQQFKGIAKNPKTQQYNKNFGVHVALQRAIKAMNKANDVDDLSEPTLFERFKPLLDEVHKDDPNWNNGEWVAPFNSYL